MHIQEQFLVPFLQLFDLLMHGPDKHLVLTFPTSNSVTGSGCLVWQETMSIPMLA